MRPARRVLITGAAGYIGSHLLARLAEQGHQVVGVDNFSIGSRRTIECLTDILGYPVQCLQADLCDQAAISNALAQLLPDTVIHCAGLKSSTESLRVPLRYYQNNVLATLHLLNAMEQLDCTKLILASSAAVYGNIDKERLAEDLTPTPATPYGHSKHMAECLIRDWTHAKPGRAAISLRYFNIIGAHHSGKIGEHIASANANLLPSMVAVAAGLQPSLAVFASQQALKDSTSKRDYLHIDDLADAHLAAVERLQTFTGHAVINLGRGVGCSVLQMLATFEAATGRTIRYYFAGHRPGDSAVSIACVAQAKALLGWAPRRTLSDACKSIWRWHCQSDKRHL